MSDEKLRVYARGNAMVPNYEAQGARTGGQPNRFHTHGWEACGPKFHDVESGLVRRHIAWMKRVGEPIELPVTAEYIKHLQWGDLYPADPETACLAGVPFVDFEHEHGEAATAEHVAQCDALRAKYADSKPMPLTDGLSKIQPKA
jgi:hypothetical protein